MLVATVALVLAAQAPPLTLSHNRHEGQGTASITVEFLNGFLELIYPDLTVPVSAGLQAGAEKFRLRDNDAEAKRLGAGATVGTIIIDSGLRYVSTDVFRT